MAWPVVLRHDVYQVRGSVASAGFNTLGSRDDFVFLISV